MVAAALVVRAAYVTAKNNITAARATRRTAIDALHEGCVDFAAQGKARFRKEETVAQRFDRLPVQDKSFAETMTRADLSIALWTDLPLVGAPPAAFTYGSGTSNVTLAQFTALRDAARTADAAVPAVDQAWQKAEGDLHVQQAALEDFVSAAVALGRSRYDEGTTEREIIEAIPGSLPANPPEQAVISSLTAEGTVITVVYSAPGATSYDVLWRPQGMDTWDLAGDDVIETTFQITSGVPGYTYEVMVRPRNSRGTGPESEIGTVQLAA
jgi:hypothetical protein